MKALTTFLHFYSWEHLPDFILEGWSRTPETRIARPPKAGIEQVVVIMRIAGLLS